MGVLVLDKPAGLTSFDVVRRVRRKLGGVKAGHTGTLDPLATGVLPICLGEATRIAGLLLAEDKVYVATAQLGLCTDTLDVSGQIIATASVSGVSMVELEQMLRGFIGEQDQVPPVFSAIRLGGRRAHELARRGEHIELKARRIHIHNITLLQWNPPLAIFRVHCSKGTYIRSLISDLGRALGCGGSLAALRRERSGCFDLEQSITLDRLEHGHVAALPIFSMDQALTHLPVVEIDTQQSRELAHGRQDLELPVEDAPLIRLRCAGVLVALAAVSNRRLRLQRVFSAAWNELQDSPVGRFVDTTSSGV